jgi:deoxycytidine triphosphate deaminase
MNTGQNDSKIEKLRGAEIERLSKLPRFPNTLPDNDRGVLLSDRIKHYCTRYQLVWPFDEKQLRPAAYSLSVGRNFSIRGVPGALNDGMSLSLEPYQVAIIETFETINMPEYLIGRWNVRTKRAYQGLLWVGGAQVDPGFRGHLCCPIYNLSTETVTLGFRDYLAEIDFATTTPFDEALSSRFEWDTRKMLVFPEYPALNSGIEKRVDAFKDTIERDKQHTSGELTRAKEETKVEIGRVAEASETSFREVRTRIDTFLTLTFTVLAVLFAGLGVVATKASEQPSLLNPTVWVAAIALFFALRALMEAHPANRPRYWLSSGVMTLVATVAAVVVCLLFYTYQAHLSAAEVHQAKEEARQAKEQMTRAVDTMNLENQTHQQSLENLQQRMSLLEKQVTKSK